MGLQTTRKINIDVSNHKYLSIDAKQYDRNLRYILITCYHQNSSLPINKKTCFASIRYRKPDDIGVFNSCEITDDGKILVELTEQMLAVAGTCYADIVIHENIDLSVSIVENADDDTVEIIDNGGSGIISTMRFIVRVHEAAFDNQEIESSYEYNALNDLLSEAKRNYDGVLNTCYQYKNDAQESKESALNSALRAQSYLSGDTGTRVGEERDNVKWYYDEMQDLFNATNIVFVPKGTIPFSDLAIVKETAFAGFMYNISDDFVTDETFREGEGKMYTAGTNVYFTIDGVWDCFSGSMIPATIDEVKEFLNI